MHPASPQPRRARRTRDLLLVALLALLALIASTGTATLYSSQPPVDQAALHAALVSGAPPVEIDWRTLAGLDHRTGQMNDLLRRLDGRVVQLPGFIVPLEDDAALISEFLLVPYFGACVHVPPPPPNQMVHVVMADGQRARMAWWLPVWIEGTLRVASHDSPYGVAGFQLVGHRVTPYEMPEGR